MRRLRMFSDSKSSSLRMMSITVVLIIFFKLADRRTFFASDLLPRLRDFPFISEPLDLENSDECRLPSSEKRTVACDTPLENRLRIGRPAGAAASALSPPLSCAIAASRVPPSWSILSVSHGCCVAEVTCWTKERMNGSLSSLSFADSFSPMLRRVDSLPSTLATGSCIFPGPGACCMSERDEMRLLVTTAPTPARRPVRR
mmetsp:Transcript_41354/g.132084  ORF Transcript_41354/g.132084 Transcript_41354/m.132084 type:complete len:201 (-) Transcript_41354:89-691(-)